MTSSQKQLITELVRIYVNINISIDMNYEY